jgi:hypothetical protein
MTICTLCNTKLQLLELADVSRGVESERKEEELGKNRIESSEIGGGQRND